MTPPAAIIQALWLAHWNSAAEEKDMGRAVRGGGTPSPVSAAGSPWRCARPGEQRLLDPGQEAEVRHRICRHAPDELDLPFALWPDLNSTESQPAEFAATIQLARRLWCQRRLRSRKAPPGQWFNSG